MAKEQDLKLEGGEVEEKSSGGKKKLIVIVLLALIVIGAGGGAAAYFLLNGGEEISDEVVEEVIEEEPDLPVQYVLLKPEFVISFQTGVRQRFLQVSIEIMTRHQSVVDALAFHEPMIRNEIIRIISAQNFENMRSAEGRIALQNLIKSSLAAIMTKEAGSDDVEAVLFTNFVLQ